MEAYISAAGDPSVGIGSTCITIDTGLVDFTHYDEAREDTRESLRQCFSDIWGEPATVVFEDEIESGLQQNFMREQYEQERLERSHIDEIAPAFLGNIA